MTKKENEIEEEDRKKKKKLTDKEILDGILKDNKGADHFNFLEQRYYKVSTSSMMMDHVTEGGLPPGLHRFTGPTESGKTKSAVDVLANFLKKHKKGKGLYVEAEGRFPRESFAQHGIKTAYKAEEWEDGTCFIYQSNVYESVAKLMEKLVLADNEAFYCIILDSVDGLAPRESFLKEYDESHKVAGGAVIASNLMKRISIPLAKRGHMAIFLSQQRSYIKIDQYSPSEHRVSQASGGNALLHYPNYIMNFEPRHKKDLILSPDAKKEAPITPATPALGHYAKVSIKKSPNETSGMQVRYPVKYHKKSGSSVWIEKEIVDTLLMWEELTKAGSWYSFASGASTALTEAGCDLPEKMQGLSAVYTAVEESDCAVDVLKDYLYQNLMQYEET